MERSFKELDVILKPFEIHLFKNKTTPGIYFLMIKKELMYIGMTRDLFNRLNSHFYSKRKHTRTFINYVDGIGIKFTDDKELHEMIYINRYDPPFNTHKNIAVLKERLKTKHSSKCNRITGRGINCQNFANENGYCYLHGGNGITREMLIDKDVEKFFDTHILI